MMTSRTTLLAAGLVGALGVGLGAFGAHGLREWLTERGMTSAWETAARYQLFHAVALVGLAAWMRSGPPAGQRRAGWVALAWCVGLVLFCGSLYGLAAGGPRWLGPVTPLGGLFLLAGWAGLGAVAVAKENGP